MGGPINQVTVEEEVKRHAGEWVEVQVWRMSNESKKARLRVKLTCSSKLLLSTTGGSGGSVAAGPLNHGLTSSSI